MPGRNSGSREGHWGVTLALVQQSGWKLSFIPYYMTSPAVWASPSVEDAIRVLSSAKYDAVEWMLGQHFHDPEDLKHLVTITREKGLAVSNIMCWQDLVTKDADARAQTSKIASGDDRTSKKPVHPSHERLHRPHDMEP